MNTPITLEMIIAFGSIIAGLLGLWWRIESRIASTASTAAEDSQANKDALAAYRLHVAETYMSKVSGGAALDRAAHDIRGIRDDIKADIVKMEKAVLDRIERVEERIFNGTVNRT